MWWRWAIGIGGAFAAALVTYWAVDEINGAMRQGEVARAASLLDDLVEQQDGDLAAVYAKYGNRMSPSTRALFEQRFGRSR